MRNALREELRAGRACAATVALFTCITAARAPAQDTVRERYELAKRVQRVERALEAARDDKAAWVRAQALLQKIEGAFVGMSTEDAERTVDEALAAVTDAPHENEPTVDGRLSLSCMGRLQHAVVAAGGASPRLTAGRAYEVPTDALTKQHGYSDTHLVVYAANDWGDAGKAQTNWGVSGMRFRWPDLELPVDGLAPGDHRVAFRSDFTVMDASGAPAWKRRGVADSPRRLDFLFSVVEDLDDKLQRLARRSRREGSPVEAQVAFLERTIRQVVDGEPVEADVPVNRLLDRALELAEGPDARADDPTAVLPDVTRGGDHWLMMTAASERLPARLIVPEQLARPAVLVVALHGMGGSEHSFVEGMGDGLAGRLARSRGWLLLCPRATADVAVLAAAVQQVRSVYDVAEQRVCVLAHSVGTVKAVELAQLDGFGCGAMAPIGGGGLVRDAAAFRDRPVHVFTGSADFARGQCARLVSELRRAGADTALHDEPGLGHLTVVQWWLPAVFGFFDEHVE